MPSLTDYVTKIKATGGLDAIDNSLIEEAVQQARRRVFQDRRWSFLDDTNSSLSTTAGVDEVDVSSITDLLHIDAVRLRDGTKPMRIDYVDPQVMRDLQDGDPKEGLPRKWSRRGTNLIFWPTPDRALTVRIDHVNYPGDLASVGSDIVPDKFQDLVTWAALVPLTYRIRDFQSSAAADQFYSNVLLPRFAMQDETAQRQTPRRVRQGYWARY